jgi:FeS assembly SUF system protein
MTVLEDIEGPEVEFAGDPVIVAKVVDALMTIYDPEIPIDIYQLGLIYKVDIEDDGTCLITMTLTTPMCPEAQSMPPKIEQECSVVEGVTHAQVDLVWDPPWTPDRMTEAAKLTLGF